VIELHAPHRFSLVLGAWLCITCTGQPLPFLLECATCGRAQGPVVPAKNTCLRTGGFRNHHRVGSDAGNAIGEGGVEAQRHIVPV
jgi:hypothetical protein